MTRTCIRCSAELGPWEGQTCLKCSWRKLVPATATIGDLGVLVLEREDRPLKAYDIVRSIRRDFEHDVNEGSLNVYLSKDRRFCWGGKGIYGLYRHRLFPGPRSIGDAALLFLYASREAMKPDVLAYVMKSVGYRFQNLSLNNALNRQAQIEWTTFGQCTLRNIRAAERYLEDIDLAPTDAAFRDVINRCRDLAKSALTQYHTKVNTIDLNAFVSWDSLEYQAAELLRQMASGEIEHEEGMKRFQALAKEAESA